MPERRATLLDEAGAYAEYAALLADPVYYGVGVPRGDGLPVIVLPGLFANDFYLHPMRVWLARLGYRPVRSSLSLNAGCPERLSRQAEAQLNQSVPAGKPVAIIGHSRGGILGWALAARLGSRASHLVLVGSPAAPLAAAVRAGSIEGAPQLDSVSAAVRRASLRTRELLDPDCEFPTCGCPFPIAMTMPLDPATQLFAITSQDDQIVPAAAAHAPNAVENHSVKGTHSGLVVNGAVYRLVAAILAQRQSPKAV